MLLPDHTLSRQRLLHCHDWPREWAPAEVVSVDLFSLHMGEVETYLLHKPLYGMLVPKIF